MKLPPRWPRFFFLYIIFTAELLCTLRVPGGILRLQLSVSVQFRIGFGMAALSTCLHLCSMPHRFRTGFLGAVLTFPLLPTTTGH